LFAAPALADRWLGATAAQAPAAPKDTAMLVKDNNTFALDLYGYLRKEKGNLFLSPYSISTALAMTYGGARGSTAEQMAKTLHFTQGQERLPAAFADLIRQINGNGKQRKYQLHVANALWGQRGYQFLPEFLTLTKQHYGAGLNEVDFKAAAEEARQTINRWVEQQTQDKIKDLIKPGMLDSRTRLVLTNAIYFKAAWLTQFSKGATRDADFHLTADNKVAVPTMHQTKEHRYLDGGTFQALELPYESGELSMVVFLPKQVDGLAELEQTLTAARLADWLPRLKQHQVEVALPRFKVTAEFQLNDALAELGMPLAFGQGADFSGMTGKKDFLISAVVHKAFVDVNEEGTEAAAATAVVMKVLSAPPTLQRVTFRADRPFLYLIRDTRTGSILFLGRVMNPQS
jgi:serpin B